MFPGLREMPPAIVAQTLDYDPSVVERHSTEIAQRWASYASYRKTRE